MGKLEGVTGMNAGQVVSTVENTRTAMKGETRAQILLWTGIL
jgi:hypothetical protein